MFSNLQMAKTRSRFSQKKYHILKFGLNVHSLTIEEQNCFRDYIYRRLHLPVNARAKNMFSRDVKRLCFRCQTLKFSRPNLSLRDLKRLCFRFQTLKFSRPNVKFSRQSRCSRGSLSLLSSQSRNLRKTCENH